MAAAPEPVAFAGGAVALYRSHPGRAARATSRSPRVRPVTRYSRSPMTVARATMAAVLLALLAAAPAEAQLRWHGCPEASGVRCARLQVPLDRAGAVPGKVPLRVARVNLGSGRRGTMMYLSGGPGGAGVLEMVDVLLTVPRLIRDFDVLGFDQRGTGRSGLLRCRALERDARLRSTSAGEACARTLGPRRSFYTTPDSVEDMEAIRRAAGVEKLTLFGISYGTELALAYARAHPDRVERLILDSTVDPDDADAFGLAGFRAMTPTLRALCPDACAGLTPDPAADLAALVARLRRAPLRGTWYTARGERRRGTVTPVALADLMYDADYNPALRAALPVAVRAALDHDDAALLLRLLRVSDSYALRSPPREFSAARYATVCEDTPLPWPRGTPPDQRRAVARAQALALPPEAFRPFDAAGRVRRRDRPLPALAGLAAPARAGRRRVPGGAHAAAPGRGGPAHAARDLRAGRGADPGRAAGDRAGGRARDRRRRPQRLRRAPAAALRRGPAGPSRAARGCRPACPPPPCRRPRSRSWRPARRTGRTVAAIDATLDFLDLAGSPGVRLRAARRRAPRRALPARPDAAAGGRGRRPRRARRRARPAGRRAAAADRRRAGGARARDREPARRAARPAGRPARPRTAGQPAAVGAPGGDRPHRGGQPAGAPLVRTNASRSASTPAGAEAEPGREVGLDRPVAALQLVERRLQVLAPRERRRDGEDSRP